MLINPNLPSGKVKTAVVSSEITPKMRMTLETLGIDVITLTGKLNCDPAVRNHPDLYFSHLSGGCLLFSKNICSLSRELPCKAENVNILLSSENALTYKDEVFFNCVSIGEDIICNPKLIHPEVLKYASTYGKRAIPVKQGYTKCNICVVDEKAVITEDKGICRVLVEYGYDVLLLEVGAVELRGHEYGFIGGASGKISKDMLAFFGCIEKHPEFEKISAFLKARGITPVSLSDECITDYGSLMPIFE